MAGIKPGFLYLAFVLLFPVFFLFIVGTSHAGEVCARVMSGSDETARFWYEIPCTDDFRASAGLGGYLGAFLITGMYASMAFPVSMAVSGFIMERLAPNKAVLTEWLVSIALIAIPTIAVLLAFR